jgi:hypothetical protein
MEDRRRLGETAAAAGLGPGSLVAADGGEVVVLRDGGRVIGLFPGRSGPNLLWTNPALESAASARRLYAQDSWANVGGDRTWLAPEIEFFFPRYPDTSAYVQPRAFDPGAYREEASEPGCLRLVNEASVTAHRAGVEIPLRMTKTVRAAANPLRDAGIPDVAYAGYALHVAVEIVAAACLPPHVGIWNLLQLPAGGELFIPTYERCVPTLFFGDIPAGHLRVRERSIAYRMAAVGEQKISVPAVATTGRMAYLWHEGRTSMLVVRSFHPDPSGAYVDAWHERPDETGFAVQACAINSGWGSFSEVEYHAPAIGGPTGLRRCNDVSQVWGFSGPRDAIARVLRALVGEAGDDAGA